MPLAHSFECVSSPSSRAALPAVVVLVVPAANRRKDDKKEKKRSEALVLGYTRLYRYACPLTRSTGNVACHARIV